MFTKSGDTFGTKEFGTQWTTTKFVWLSIGTMLVTWYVWMYNLLKECKEKQNVVNLNPTLILWLIGLSNWGYLFCILIPIFIFFLPIIPFVIIGTYIYIAIKARTAIHLILQEHNLYAPLNIFLTIIFPGFYHYYCIRNAEVRFAEKSGKQTAAEPKAATEKSNTEKLAELAKLKESGVLTEEEFQAEKKKILG